MKNILLLLLLPLLFSNCKKEENPTLFDIPLPNIDFEIPPTASSFEVHYFNINNVVTNKEGLFSANNISESDAVAIVPKTGSLRSITNNIDFEFIEQMSIRICDEDDLSQNCGTEIFWRQPVPNNVGSILDLVPSDIDIKQYLLQEKVNIQVKLERLRANPPQFVETRLVLDFAVK